MGHSHEGHCHHHSVSSLENINRAFYIGIGLNLLYTVIEFAVGFKINSLALISDASHNLSDVASLGISLIGIILAQKASTHSLTYGYKKASILASLINAILLVFIVFKINLLLNGVTDPIKRSEAISSIVQSISVIKDPILRDTYIRECSNRTGVAERTLMEQMNRNIHQYREQQTREQQFQKEAALREGQGVEQPAASTILQVSKVERIIMQTLVKDGDKVILRDIKDESTGQLLNITVAQYIAYTLMENGLSLTNPLYIKMLQEAVDHSADPQFKSEEYFTQHADIDIANEAVRLSVDRFQLSESLKVKETEHSLRDRVLHIMTDYLLDYYDSHLKELVARMKQTKDTDEMMSMLKEINAMQNKRNILAKRLGSDILI